MFRLHPISQPPITQCDVFPKMVQWKLTVLPLSSFQGPSSSASSSPPSRNFAGEFAKFAQVPPSLSDTDSADSDDEGGREFKRRQEELKKEQKKGEKGSGKG